MFLLLVIYFCNKPTDRIVPTSKEFSVFSWKPLSPEVSRLSPHSRTTTYANFKNLLHIRGTPTKPGKLPFIGGESDVPWKERQILDRQYRIASIQRFFKTFAKITYHSVYCKPNPGRSPHMRHQIYIYKENR